MAKIKIGVVGMHFGRSLMREQMLRGEGERFLEVACVCDANRALADEAAAEAGVKAVYDLDALLNDPGIEAVGLFTGPAGRAGLIRRAIRAGKHVMTTKPFELDAGAALEVLKEARELGRVVHLNSPRPVPSPDVAQIEKWRQEFELGRVVAARGDIWANYREQADGSWYDDPAKCPVAPIFRLGIYLINDLVRLVGEPEGVQVLESRLFTGRPTADNAQLGILFKGGAIANVFASFCVNDGHFWASSLTLNFENGTVYRNVGPTGNDARKIPELSLVTRDGNGSVARRAASVGSTEDYAWEYFYRAARGERDPGETTPEQVAAGIKTLSAMGRAAAGGRGERV